MVDLHMHSCFSEDGQYTPAELVSLCAGAGVRTMSVTDHNCAKANLEAQELAKKKGIRYIPGIEVDCTFDGVGFHVLGYYIDPESQDMENLEKNIARQNREASRERLRKTQKLGFAVTEEEMWAPVGRGTCLRKRCLPNRSMPPTRCCGPTAPAAPGAITPM